MLYKKNKSLRFKIRKRKLNPIFTKATMVYTPLTKWTRFTQIYVIVFHRIGTKEFILYHADAFNTFGFIKFKLHLLEGKYFDQYDMVYENKIDEKYDVLVETLIFNKLFHGFEEKDIPRISKTGLTKFGIDTCKLIIAKDQPRMVITFFNGKKSYIDGEDNMRKCLLGMKTEIEK